MLVQVCLLLLSVGVYASYEDSFESTTADPLFDEMEVFPENFLSRFPQEGEFFRTKILVYLFFNLFSKHFAENEPVKFWSKFNKNSFNRIAVDAVFYEYLTKFTDKKMKHLVFNPLESSTSGTTEAIAMDRIGDYLDNLSAAEVATGQSETRWQAAKTIGHKHRDPKCVTVPLTNPIFGISGKDFPNFCDIPKTSFTCANKLIPGVYADIETGCQVFHACWPNRIDSFLCPIGATFNQALLTCDFWHESSCSASFDYSLFGNGKKTPRDVELTNDIDDETLPTSESSTAELVIPEYDGTCRSLITKPMKLHMKFRPVKCKVGDLKPSTSEGTGKWTKFDGARISELARLADIMSWVFRDALVSILEEDASNDITRIQGGAKLPKLKEKAIPKSVSTIVEAVTEFASNPEEIDTMSEEQMYHSTTELPSEDFPPSPNSGFVEKPVFWTTSHGKVKPGKNEPLKPNKLSEDSKKHELDVMLKTLELSRNMLSDDILPFLEKIILDSPRKMLKSEES